MDLLEKNFKEYLLENLGASGTYQYNIFKGVRKELFFHTLEYIRKVNNDKVNTEKFTLVREDITRVTLKEGKRKVFVFCGTYIYKGNTVILLENTESVGTYFLDSAPIVRQLKLYRIGMRVGLEKTEIGINMTLPYEDVNIGLFE